MTLDSHTAASLLATGVHGVVAYIGTSIFCVVAEQPAWLLPIFCAAVSTLPGFIKIYRDHRLKHALAEVERQKRRAEIAEARLAKDPA